jgi:hypothetical protein
MQASPVVGGIEPFVIYNAAVRGKLVAHFSWFAEDDRLAFS